MRPPPRQLPTTRLSRHRSDMLHPAPPRSLALTTVSLPSMELITLHDARREPITFLYATERRLRSSTESSLGCCATAFMWSTISSKLSGGRKIHERAPGGGGGGGGGGEHRGAAVEGGRRRGEDQSILRSEHHLSVYLPELKAQARAHTHAPVETTRTSERHTKRETKKQHEKKAKKIQISFVLLSSLSLVHIARENAEHMGAQK